MNTLHTPVLLQELVDVLALRPHAVVVDATLGGGGHAEAIAELLDEQGVLIGIDQDHDAIELARERLQHVRPTVHLIENSFRHLDTILARLGIAEVSAVALDLGLSSDQLGQSGRGFSFKGDEPLLMTFSAEPEEGVITAHDIVNDWEEVHIADILHGFGEERFAKRIAKAIVEARAEKSIERTGELVRVIERSVPKWYRFKRIHPATKTFQALRMAVNDEVGALRDVLRHGVEHLAAGGHFAVISFHSVEDRIVKTFFAKCVREGVGSLVHKKPMVPRTDEIASNPRARSAKLRTFKKA